MAAASSPARLGVWDEIVPRLEAAGWIVDGAVPPAAATLLEDLRSGPEPEAALERLVAVLDTSLALAAESLQDQERGRALVAICGASRELSRTLAAHPDWLPGAHDRPLQIETGSDPRGELRRHVRRSMLSIAVDDLLGRTDMPEVGRALSDLADAASSVALQIARVEAADRSGNRAPVPVAVIAMGKWGARELNYASDIDLLFIHDTGSADPGTAARYARTVASSFIEILSTHSPEGVAFRVDADLRPEGKSGPLSRSIEAYTAYYERWASTWEFQALLKARPAAGDPELGARFMEMIEPFVYPETLDPEAVREVRAMKGRTEEETRRKGIADSEIKRGIGGIRDVEFSVQLLQLVHGRTDLELRAPATMDGLHALQSGGYIRQEDGDDLVDAYPWLRDVEHRLQLYDLRQTHELPSDGAGIERLAKAMGYRDDPARDAREAFEADLVRHRALVRTIHQRLFYRPLLEAFAASPAVHLTPDRVARQLTALGFRDVAGAERAFADLTAGLSRRSRLMQQLLPLILDWLSTAPDPDLGLAQLRTLVTTSPDNARLIAELRDNPVAAERLCRLLGTSRLVGHLVDQIPESLGFLGDDTALASAPDAGRDRDEILRAIQVRPGVEERQAAIRRFVRRKVLRTAVRDLLGYAGPEAVGDELTAVADAAAVAAYAMASAGEETADFPFAVIAMGRWGGGELHYASDLDLLFVYKAPNGMDQPTAATRAHEIAERFMWALGGVTAQGVAFKVDADLRPEGKSGPLARSLDAYATYYDRWAQTWEMQSLLKARPAAGDPAIAAAFAELTAPLVYRSELPDAVVREVRTMKARIERERISPQEDPAFHMKLGHGSLSDIEFTVQLLQLQHAGALPELRVPGTLDGLRALHHSGLLTDGAAARLEESYLFCSRVRNRLFLQAGRARDSLPSDPDQATRLALSLGFTLHPRTSLRETYRRVTRRARRVVSDLFYGSA